MIMNKFLVFCKSDGIKNAIWFSIKSITNVLFHHSSTKCIYLERKSFRQISKPEWDRYSYKIFDKAEDIATLPFDRLKLLPYRKWMENGSLVIVAFDGKTPVAFGWTHFRSQTIHYVGTFDMGDDIAWLGPVFVHKDSRGKGLQKLIMQLGITTAPNNINCFITSVNSGNAPSWSSLLKLGFKEGLDISTQSGILCKKAAKINEVDKKSQIYLRLK